MNDAVNPTYEDLSEKYSAALFEIEKLKRNELKLLKFLQDLKNDKYGRKTEKLSNLDIKQLALLELEGVEIPEELAKEEQVGSYSRKKKKLRKSYDHLLRERHEYQPEETNCTGCGAELEKIGEEVTEQIEYVPAQYKVVEHAKIKKACPKCKSAGVSIGSLPAGVPVIPGSKAGATLISSIVVNKFCDHLPLYRQEQILLRNGLDIPRQRMSDWLGQVSLLLLCIYEAIRKEILKESYIHADETWLEVQDLEKENRLHKGYLWGLLGPPGVYFRYSTSRASAVAEELLLGYSGFLQADAYAGYNSVAEQCIRVGCWAHVRRRFVELQKISGAEAGKVLKLISTLYKLEKDQKGQRLPLEKVAEIRRKKSSEVLQKLKDYLKNLQISTLPKHPLREAVDYALNQWSELTVFLRDPRISLDNNIIENQIRPVAVGRKNWLFAGSHEGAQNSAVLYSIIGTCKMHGVNPQDYLQDVLRRVHHHPINRVSELLPQNWKKLE